MLQLTSQSKENRWVRVGHGVWQHLKCQIGDVGWKGLSQTKDNISKQIASLQNSWQPHEQAKSMTCKSGPNSTQGFSLICSMHEITTSSDAPNPGGPYMQQIIMTWVCASQASITITTNHFPEDKHHTGRIDESLLWINLMNPTCWAWLLESRYVQSCHLGQIKFYFMSPRRREKYPLPSIMHPLNKSQTKSC
jgi:hypothetical protein